MIRLDANRLSVIVTGSLPPAQISDCVATSSQFYRMQLIDFQ